MKKFLKLLFYLFIVNLSKVKSATVTTELISITSTAIFYEEPRIDTGEFQFEFNISSIDNDYYFNFNNLSFSIIGGLSTTSDIFISSSAYENESKIFKVKEGHTENFFLSIQVLPNEDSVYAIKLNSVDFNNDSSGNHYSMNFNNEYISPRILLRANRIPEPSVVLISVTLLAIAVLSRNKRFRWNT